MTTHTHIRPIARFFVLLTAALLLATCGDDGTGPSGESGVFGEMAVDLKAAESTALGTNADIFASAEVMMPYINAILFPAATSGSSSAGTGVCLPEGVGGKIYSFDGSAYTGTGSASIIESVARFWLYRISEFGQPQENQMIGYIDFTCFETQAVSLTEVQLSLGTTVVASTTFSSIIGRINGAFRDAPATHLVNFEGNVTSPQARLTLEFDVSDRFSATYGHQLPGGASGPVVLTVTDPEGSSEGAYAAQFSVNPADNVTGGYAQLSTDSGSFVAACINSGTLADPAFSAPSADCFPDSESVSMLVSPAQLEAMSDSYQPLRAFWLAAANLVEICRSLVPDEE
jgi:hypothetical protein